jgi:hypothetical protein
VERGVLALLLGTRWVFQLRHLMSASDPRFPDRFVRFGRAAAFVLPRMVTPFARVIWWSRPSPRRDRRIARAAD